MSVLERVQVHAKGQESGNEVMGKEQSRSEISALTYTVILYVCLKEERAFD